MTFLLECWKKRQLLGTPEAEDGSCKKIVLYLCICNMVVVVVRGRGRERAHVCVLLRVHEVGPDFALLCVYTRVCVCVLDSL